METHFPAMDDAQGQLARERIMADLRALAGDAEALLRATADDASDKAKATRERLSAAIEKAKTTCDELQNRGIESAKAAVKRADDTIRGHPYESIAIAFGLGLLIGIVLKRK